MVCGIDVIYILNKLINMVTQYRFNAHWKTYTKMQFEILSNDIWALNGPSDWYSGTNMTFILIFTKE